jgi:hypothetical protein
MVANLLYNLLMCAGKHARGSQPVHISKLYEQWLLRKL